MRFNKPILAFGFLILGTYMLYVPHVLRREPFFAFDSFIFLGLAAPPAILSWILLRYVKVNSRGIFISSLFLLLTVFFLAVNSDFQQEKIKSFFNENQDNLENRVQLREDRYVELFSYTIILIFIAIVVNIVILIRFMQADHMKEKLVTICLIIAIHLVQIIYSYVLIVIDTIRGGALL